jgi:DNA-binding response OmpR family regulator
VDVVADGESALEHMKRHKPDIVLLDLGLPGVPGREVCSRMKAQLPGLPIIIVSAKTDEWDKVMLLEMGADDQRPDPSQLGETEETTMP